MTAVREADWVALLPRLAAYAEQRLRHVGWLDGKDVSASAASVMDVVNNAIESALTGARNWKDSAAADLEQFLCGVIRSQVSSAKKKAVRSRTFASADPAEHATEHNLAVGSGDELAGLDRKWSEIGDALAGSIDGDPDLEAVYLTVVADDGPTKREAIAFALQWPPERVSAARIKFKRRLLKNFPELFERYAKRRTS